MVLKETLLHVSIPERGEQTFTPISVDEGGQQPSAEQLEEIRITEQARIDALGVVGTAHIVSWEALLPDARAEQLVSAANSGAES